MKYLLSALCLTVAVSADCLGTATAYLQDPDFAWIIKGTSAERSGNVSKLCAATPNAALDKFDAQLDNLTMACVPGGVATDTTGLAMALSMMKTILCEQRANNYCILSFLPLFDLNYMLQVSSASGFVKPVLKEVLDNGDRTGAMCHSSECYYFVEQKAQELLLALPPTAPADLANNVRYTVSRMRCGCWDTSTPCQNSANTDALVKCDANGCAFTPAACDNSGMISTCARNFMTCEHMAPPICSQPCNEGEIAKVSFALTNLDWDCFSNALSSTPGAAIGAVKADIEANIRALCDKDFLVTCNVNTAGHGTQCDVTVNCLNLAAIPELNLAGAIAYLTKHAHAAVVATPNIDALAASATCEVTPDAVGQWNHFALLSTSVTLPPSGNSASTLALGLSLFASLALSIFL